MLQQKTLFVVGAGASSEVGLPIGRELMDSIAGKINIRFEHGWEQTSGDHEITEALRQHTQQPDGRRGDINPYLHAAWRICNAMPQATSIDSFIDSHHGDEKIAVCGKLAIVRSILEAEQRSKLAFVATRHDSTINFGGIKTTWFNRFAHLLFDGRRKADISACFDNASFIVFNYDRCVEHFFFYALQNYYGVSADEATRLMSTLEISHPYGTVGRLPWQQARDPVPFGAKVGSKALLGMSGRIKTYSEQVEDEATINGLRRQMHEAETIVFLGFAFHRQNMELVKPNNASRVKRVFATAKGISNSGCNVVRRQILETLQKKEAAVTVHVRNEFSCFELFDEFARDLALS